MLNRKVLVGIAVGILGIIIVALALLPGSGVLKNMIPSNVQLPGSLDTLSSDIDPLDVKLNKVSVEAVSEKEVVLELEFDVSNPNKTTVLLEMISFEIYANGEKVGFGEIGQRLSGQYTSSNYYTVLSDYPLTITGKTTIKNTGKNPEFWSTIKENVPEWRITGEAFYSTTSAFSGIAGSTVFDYTK
jgi:LEA14-like dessication related protein